LLREHVGVGKAKRKGSSERAFKKGGKGERSCAKKLREGESEKERKTLLFRQTPRYLKGESGKKKNASKGGLSEDKRRGN